ncbi:MAG TPA: nitroreductase [Actinoplanes sp.]|nr:nitroreductase [Actinoplanes sp.]
MNIEAPTRAIDTRTAVEALVAAAKSGGYAPSIGNTQPWRWRLTGDTLDLHLERSRIRSAADLDGRLATLSCGAALHHARVTMAAHGWDITVTRMLQGADRDLLARLHVNHRSPADPTSAALQRMIPGRHIDRRAAADSPLNPEALATITAAVEAEGTRLHTLRTDQILDLAAAVERAQLSAAADPARQAELMYWTGLAAPNTDGTAPHGRGTVFIMLYGTADEPLNWLRAGEALSAGWISAAGQGVSVQPHSAPTETIATREAMRAMIARVGHPFLVLRLGMADPSGPGTPRLPTDQIIERY